MECAIVGAVAVLHMVNMSCSPLVDRPFNLSWMLCIRRSQVPSTRPAFVSLGRPAPASRDSIAVTLKGHVFDDVVTALQWWKAQGVKVYIYSSGSVGAQKLLFGNSKFGDLLPLIEGHFDTAVGAKVEAASYAAIAKALGVPVGSIVFVSDSEAELQAARAAGIGWPVMCCRPGNKPLTTDSCGFAAVRSMMELCRGKNE
mmetsp:Transcript_22830/g.41126  ORF Transcript_22830/g.41126 Transcript_22830/m.41126 type:complete len:200 (-) Transcript_22830:1126-1725(-)